MGLDQMKEVHVECSVLKLEDVKNTRGFFMRNIFSATISPSVEISCGGQSHKTASISGQTVTFNSKHNNSKQFEFKGWNKTPTIDFMVWHNGKQVAECSFDLQDKCGDYKADKRNTLTFTEQLYWHKNWKNATEDNAEDAGQVKFSLVWTGLDFSDEKNCSTGGGPSPGGNPVANVVATSAQPINSMPSAPVVKPAVWQFQTASGWKNMDYSTGQSLENQWRGMQNGLSPIFTNDGREYNVQNMTQKNTGSDRSRSMRRVE